MNDDLTLSLTDAEMDELKPRVVLRYPQPEVATGPIAILQ